MRRFLSNIGGFFDGLSDKFDSKLNSGKFNIVKHRKKFFLISSGIILLGIIGMIIFGALGETTGGALNFGTDFVGGYSLKVELKSRIDTAEGYDTYSREIKGIIEGLEDDDGVAFGLRVQRMQKQGEGEDSSIYITYKGVRYLDYSIDESMSDHVNPAVEQALKLKYFSGANKYEGQVVMSGSVGAAVSQELILGAIGAIVLASVLMFLYIMFRFELSSGIAAIVAVLHDILVMITFMAFTRVTVNSSFIAAIITIMGYAINNSIIIFDRIRETSKAKGAQKMTGGQIVNSAVRDSLTRTINTTFTTLVTIVLVTIIGVPAIREFSFPIIIGLLSGFYSSTCLAPSIWATWRDNQKQRNKKAYAKRRTSSKYAK